MSTTYIPSAVPIAELAKVLGRKVAEIEAECAEVDVFVGLDWAGRAAVAESDAERIVSGSARRALEAEATWARHLETCRAWTTARDEAVRVAASAYTAASSAQGRFGPDADSRAREAGSAAGRDFELSTLVPLWGGEECGNARRLFADTDGKPGILTRARDLFAGGPR